VETFDVRVEVTRGQWVESWHRVHVAVLGPDGVVRGQAGDPDTFVFARSSVKPIQALPLVDDGVVSAFGLTEEELALCCASHNAEPRHVELATSILRKAGLDERALACGPHPPYYEPAAKALMAEGLEPGRIHNNCSGKHAGMLALARHHGWPTDGYHRPDHPVQRRMLEEVTRWTGTDAAAVRTATDGCGVVTFGLPLRGLALAFARLAQEAAARPQSAPGRIVAAMTGHPFAVAGTGRLCTELMRVADGRLVAKTGAEGVYAVGVLSEGLGVALKVEDGAKRASEPALLAVLGELGLLSGPELEALRAFAMPVVRNTRDEDVGAIRARIMRVEDNG
jgi:L-asparaginase II